MNTLRLEIINLHAPYRVKQREDKPQDYYFKTDYGVEYDISLEEDFSIVPSGAYALDITNREHKRSPLDPKFKLTLIAIIEEFFDQNNDVMLYVTETGDEKQSFRDRLFVRWFNTYERHNLYYIQTAEGMMEGQLNFMAIISRKDNPRLHEVIHEFEDTISFIFD
jgi:hypothetical protein